MITQTHIERPVRLRVPLPGNLLHHHGHYLPRQRPPDMTLKTYTKGGKLAMRPLLCLNSKKRINEER